MEAKAKNGLVILDTDEFNKLAGLLDDGRYLLTMLQIREPKTIDEYRAEYFAKRDVVAAETGNSKADIHNMAKGWLLTDGMTSTKELDIEGWKAFLQNFKEWAFEFLNVYL